MDIELFLEDLASRLDAAERQRLAAAVRELTEAERTSVTLAHRLAAAQEQMVTLVLSDGTRLAGKVQESGRYMCVLADLPRVHYIPLAAVAAVSGLPSSFRPLQGVAATRKFSQYARRLAHSRQRVRVNVGCLYVGEIVSVHGDGLDVQTDTGRVTIAENAIVCVTAL